MCIRDSGGPELFQTRWAMNYMAGPMTRNRIADLNALAGAAEIAVEEVSKEELSAKPSPKSRKLKAKTKAPVEEEQESTVEDAVVDTALKQYTATRATVASGLDEYFLPRQLSFYRALQSRNKPISVNEACLLYTSPSPRDATLSRMPSSA